jgi:hypothetical protein
MRIKALLAVLVFAAFAVACDQNVPTQPAADIAAPAFSFNNNPDNGNPRIVRFGSRSTFLLIDEEANLFSIHSGRDFLFVPFLGLGSCRDVTFETFRDIQRILHDPDLADPFLDQVNQVSQGRGVFIAVFEGPFGTVTDCDVLLDRLLAEGFGNLTNTDNDLAAFLRESTNANAFGFTAQANNLELVGGGQAKYNGVSRCVWDGNTGEDLFHCKDKINFH